MKATMPDHVVLRCVRERSLVGTGQKASISLSTAAYLKPSLGAPLPPLQSLACRGDLSAPAGCKVPEIRPLRDEPRFELQFQVVLPPRRGPALTPPCFEDPGGGNGRDPKR